MIVASVLVFRPDVGAVQEVARCAVESALDLSETAMVAKLGVVLALNLQADVERSLLYALVEATETPVDTSLRLIASLANVPLDQAHASSIRLDVAVSAHIALSIALARTLQGVSLAVLLIVRENFTLPRNALLPICAVLSGQLLLILSLLQISLECIKSL